MLVTIYHNPQCGTSRKVLDLIRQREIEPRIIEYLKNPPSQAELADIIAKINLPVRDLLRQKGSPYDELDLGNEKWRDAELLELMIIHPILINRPIVVTPKGVRLCRPVEKVLEIL